MAAETRQQPDATAFDPRKPRSPRRAVGGPPPRQLATAAEAEHGATVGEGAAVVVDPVPVPPVVPEPPVAPPDTA